MQLVSILLGSIMLGNIVLAFTVIFMERKNASSTWAWIMVLFFIPVLGFMLYLLFGRRLSGKRIFSAETKRQLGIKEAAHSQLEILKTDQLPFKLTELEPYKELFYLHINSNDAIYTQNNEVTLYTDGQEKFTSLINDLEQAVDHIHL